MGRQEVEDAMRRMDLIIHVICPCEECKSKGIADEDIVLRDGYMNAHTHGAWEFCGYEFQTTDDRISRRDIGYILNESVIYFSDHREELDAKAKSNKVFTIDPEIFGLSGKDFIIEACYVEEIESKPGEADGFIGIRLNCFSKKTMPDGPRDLASPYINRSRKLS